jgi:hypothetical protein
MLTSVGNAINVPPPAIELIAEAANAVTLPINPAHANRFSPLAARSLSNGSSGEPHHGTKTPYLDLLELVLRSGGGIPLRQRTVIPGFPQMALFATIAN